MSDAFFVRLGACAATLLFAVPAFAQTATTDFNVRITITGECVVDSATDLEFGSTGFIDADVSAASAIAVTCTNGTPYDVALNVGQGSGATFTQRLMTGPGGETVEYSLYRDAAHAEVWGETEGVDTVSAIGTGTTQSHDVFGLVPVQNTPSPGDYSDLITVTVSY